MEEEREYVVVAPNEVLVRGSSWTDGQVLGSLVRGDSFWATGPTVDQDGGRRRVPIRWELPTPRSSRAEDGSSAWDVARNAHNAWVTEVTAQGDVLCVLRADYQAARAQPVYAAGLPVDERTHAAVMGLERDIEAEVTKIDEEEAEIKAELARMSIEGEIEVGNGPDQEAEIQAELARMVAEGVIDADSWTSPSELEPEPEPEPESHPGVQLEPGSTEQRLHDEVERLRADVVRMSSSLDDLSRNSASDAATLDSGPRSTRTGPTNSPGHWDIMISYTQRNATAKLLAAELYTSLRERGKTVWLDTKMERLNEAAMQEAAQNSKCLVAVVTGAEREGDPEDNAYFRRTLCLKELRWAREAGVPIQPVVAREDKASIGQFIGQLPEDLSDLSGVDFKTLDNVGPAYWKTSIDEVVKGVDWLVPEPEPEVDSFQLEQVTWLLEPEPEPELSASAVLRPDLNQEVRSKRFPCRVLVRSVYM